MPPEGHIDDQALLLKLQAGDSRAFEQLYGRYSRSLLWKLEKMLKDTDEADELLQDLFVRVWERREQVDPSQPFAGYLYRIAQHMVADHFRKIARTASLHRQVQTEQSEVSFATEEYLNNKETQKLLDEALAGLSEQRRQAFTLCKMEGKTHKEAAILMGISPHTVHNHLTKATQAVKAYLDGKQNPIGLLLLVAAIAYL